MLEDEFNDYDGAKQQYLNAIHIDPNETSTRLNLAVLLEQGLNDLIGARQQYCEVLRLDEKDIFGRSRLIKIIMKLTNMKK